MAFYWVLLSEYSDLDADRQCNLHVMIAWLSVSMLIGKSSKVQAIISVLRFLLKKKKKKEKNRKPGIMLKQTSCGLSVDRTGSIFYRYLRKKLRQNNSELFTSKISKVIESIVNVGRVFSVSSCGFGNSVCFACSFEVIGFPWALEMDNFQNEIFPFWNLVTFIDICASYAIPSLFNVISNALEATFNRVWI